VTPTVPAPATETVASPNGLPTQTTQTS
jgi:hypothetical protein